MKQVAKFFFNDMHVLDHGMKGAEYKTAEWLGQCKPWPWLWVLGSGPLGALSESNKKLREERSLDSLQGRELLLPALAQSLAHLSGNGA